MRINNNMMAMNTQRQLIVNQGASQKSIEKLSSGQRINRAGDDAAGLAISEKMRGQIKGLQQASRNAQDGISLIQTAEGALSETHSILQRVRELAVQSSNDSNVTVDRQAIKEELAALSKEITRIANNTEFNTQKLLGTAAPSALVVHIGANSGQNIEIVFTNMQATGTLINIGTSDTAIGISAGQSVGDVLVGIANTAIVNVSTQRAKIGAIQNRLEHTIKNLDTAAENLQASESRVRDVDMAREMMEFTKDNILNQAATAMLAQANQAPQGVLQLLR